MEKLSSYCRQYDKQEDRLWKVIELILPLRINRYVFYYHDESCFYGHNYKKTIWLDSIIEQQKMLSKSKGKLIHVSDFIRTKGRIAIPELGLNARKIIYLGARRDLQQDTKQLLVQISTTLEIFEKKHPNYIIVLVFD